jgi:hypothetical protein
MTYPQLNLRLYVLDGNGLPAVLFRRMLMPMWVTPGVRLVSHHPVTPARLAFPRPSRHLEEGSWQWRVERGGSLAVQAWPDSPRVGEGPRLGNWEQTVRYIQERSSGYTEAGGRLHRIDAQHPPAPVWPLRAELQGSDLFPSLFGLPGFASNGGNGQGGQGGLVWPGLHSTWLCPEIPFVFELGLVPQRVPVPHVVPQPMAGRLVSPVWREEARGRSGSGHGGRRAAAGAVLASAA